MDDQELYIKNKYRIENAHTDGISSLKFNPSNPYLLASACNILFI
jgi:hypothetical protein